MVHRGEDGPLAEADGSVTYASAILARESRAVEAAITNAVRD